MRQYIRKPLPERFWPKVQITANPNKCWEWAGGLSPNGYGVIGSSSSGDRYSAHRLAYKLTHGDIPDGLFVLHKCDNRKCCNPNHLWAGTHLENVSDMMAKHRHRSDYITHCPKGHAYDTDNTLLFKGARFCRACKKERDRIRRSKDTHIS